MSDKRYPNLVEQYSENDSWVIVFEAPKDLVYFDGHFDQAAVLPGVVQLTWAEYYGRGHFKFQGKFSHLEAIKFQNVIVPEQRVSLTLRYEAEKGKLHFRFESDSGRHSSGRFVFV
ncbi:ApeI family dehydratase [Aurantivibrio plasticivorans]